MSQELSSLLESSPLIPASQDIGIERGRQSHRIPSPKGERLAPWKGAEIRRESRLLLLCGPAVDPREGIPERLAHLRAGRHGGLLFGRGQRVDLLQDHRRLV